MLGRENGRLEITLIDSVTIRDGRDDHVALEYVVTNDTYLYAGPAQVGNDSLARKHYPSSLSSAAAAVPDLTLWTPVSNGNGLFLAFDSLKKNRKIFARKIPGYPDVLEVLTFTPNVKKLSGMEETNLGVEAGLRGYIDIRNARPDQAAGESFEPWPENTCLFPNIDLMKDVVQYRLGDCFLLASIQAILTLSNGSDLIRGMMVKDGNDTIVRLFHPDTHDPVYIRVSNSVYHRVASTSPKLRLFGRAIGQKTDDQMINHNAPWVHILEKAYVALGVEEASVKDAATTKHVTTSPSFRQQFGNGGHTATAVSVLTGMAVKEIEFKKRDRLKFDSDTLLTCYWRYVKYQLLLDNAEDLLSLFDNALQTIDDDAYKQLMGRLQFVQDSTDDKEVESAINTLALSPDLKSALIKFVNSNNAELLVEYLLSAKNDIKSNNELTRLIGGYSKYLFVGKAIDLDKIIGFSETEQSDSDKVSTVTMDKAGEDLDLMLTKIMHDDIAVTRRAKEIIKSATLFAPPNGPDTEEVIAAYDGPVGSGLYAQHTNDVFEAIKKGFLSQNVMTASTYSEKSDLSVEGVYNRHAYTVMGVREEKMVKSIRLRNPWGHTGHVSEWNNLHAVYVSRESAEHGEFEIELSLFVRAFKKCTIGDATVLRAIESQQIKNDREQLERDKGIIAEERARLDDEQKRLKDQQNQQREIAELQATEARRLADEKASFYEEQQKWQHERNSVDRQREVVLTPEENSAMRHPIKNRRHANRRTIFSYQREIALATVVTGLSFAGAGFALGWFFAPVTLGLSVPVMAAIAGVSGLVVGAVLGFTGSLMVSGMHASSSNRGDRREEASSIATVPLLGTTKSLQAAMPAGISQTVTAEPALREGDLDLGDGLIMRSIDAEVDDELRRYGLTKRK